MTPPHGVVFIGENKGKLSRNFYFDPFLLYLAFSRASPRERHECKNLIWFLLVFAAPLRAWNAAWRPCFAKTFVPKNFPNKPCENKVPTTDRECKNLTWFLLVFAAPLRAWNAAWCPCLAKTSVPKFSRTNLARTKFQHQTANPGTFHDFCSFLLPRLVLETLRGAHALQKFPCRKFPEQTAREQSSNIKPRIPELPMIFARFATPPRAWNAAWRPCLAKISPQEIFDEHLWKNEVPTKERECS